MKKKISGKLEYEKDNSNIDSFIGFLKLKKDPKVEKLNIENLILRDSVLDFTAWIFGLVVYTGGTSKIL